jgi:hypothetical protein
MGDIEVVAIDGLDDAIIGSTVRNGREVLAYDYEKAVEIIVAAGHSQEFAEEWVAELSYEEFDGAPAFVYFDDQKFYGSSTPSGATRH